MSSETTRFNKIGSNTDHVHLFLMVPLCFFPDYAKSVLLGPHWQWSVTDIPVYITGNILPFQVSLPGNPNEYHMAIIPHVYQHTQSHAQLYGTVQHSVESFCSVISFTIYQNTINHFFFSLLSFSPFLIGA